jgi:hypothetical protein
MSYGFMICVFFICVECSIDQTRPRVLSLIALTNDPTPGFQRDLKTNATIITESVNPKDFLLF